MAALREDGLAARIGVAPGPANGFTLDLISCLERFGDRIDWAMIILNPFEPWPGELCLDAAARHDVQVLTRVVDYGGIFWGDMSAGMELGRTDHRSFRPAGWIEAGLEKLERVMPYAERAGLTPIQLACQWNLAHPAVACVAPTLIQETGPRGAPDRGQAGRAGRAAGRDPPLRRGRRRDPRDRRQRQLHGAEGRHPRPRGRGAARQLAAERRPRGGRRALGDRPRRGARRDALIRRGTRLGQGGAPVPLCGESSRVPVGTAPSCWCPPMAGWNQIGIGPCRRAFAAEGVPRPSDDRAPSTPRLRERLRREPAAPSSCGSFRKTGTTLWSFGSFSETGSGVPALGVDGSSVARGVDGIARPGDARRRGPSSGGASSLAVPRRSAVPRRR